MIWQEILWTFVIITEATVKVGVFIVIVDAVSVFLIIVPAPGIVIPIKYPLSALYCDLWNLANEMN